MDRWRRALGWAQIALVASPLLFLVLALGNGARAGFAPEAADYGRNRYKPAEEAPKLVKDWERIVRQPQGARVAIWGLAERPGGAATPEAAGVILARLFAERGAQVQVSHPSAVPAGLLPAGVEPVPPDPAGATVLILACEEPEYRAPDFARLKERLAPPGLLMDCWGGWDGGAAEAAGLVYWQYGQPTYPAWLDPEFRAAVAAWNAQTRPGDAILLVPRKPLSTYSPRSRWFLHLNYFLYPRALFLPYPAEASGTMVQYWDWVNRLRAEGPPQGPVWQGEVLAQALAASDADWQLRYLPNNDFRASDWRLLPAKDAEQ